MTKPDPAELADLRRGKIYVAGHRGMVGSALVRRLQRAGCKNLLLKSRAEVDLENQQQVLDLIRTEKPDYIFLAAARVGGIHANNSYPASFIYSNLMIASNVINAAREAKVHRLLNLGSSCIYPDRMDFNLAACTDNYGPKTQRMRAYRGYHYRFEPTS